MSYYDKKVNGTLPDPGDEPKLTEEEEFELLRDAGAAPERMADPEFAKRYAAWLEKNPAETA